MSLFIRFNDRLDRAVRHQMITQPKALAYALSSYAEAESGGENLVFERCLARVQDPKVKAMIRRHQDDEIRHASMLDARREALGLPRMIIPEELKVVQCLSREAGGVLDLPMDEDRHVALAYHLLFVVEERALDEFGRAIAAFRLAGDAGTADLFASIQQDEARHLKYCDAIARRYSADTADFERERARMRAVERLVYGQQARGFTLHLLREGLLVLPEPWNTGFSWLLRATNAMRLPAPAALAPAMAA
jgi:rubrerythrin